MAAEMTVLPLASGVLRKPSKPPRTRACTSPTMALTIHSRNTELHAPVVKSWLKPTNVVVTSPTWVTSTFDGVIASGASENAPVIATESAVSFRLQCPTTGAVTSRVILKSCSEMTAFT